MTIVEMYNAIMTKCEGVLSTAEMDFLRERADLVAKKNATRKPTKAQEENEDLKEQIVEMMVDGEKYTVTDIMKAIGLESNQKTSALVRQLKDEGKVVRSEIKGRAYFSLA